MLRPKVTFLFVMAPAILLSSCAPGVQYTPPPDLTLGLGTDTPQQITTVTPDIFTQTSEPVTSTPVPGVATVLSSSNGLKPPDNETPSVVAVAPPPIVEYNNSAIGYGLNLPGDWRIDESGMTTGTNKEVIFSPPIAEPFVSYLSVSLEFRTLDQIIGSYSQYYPEGIREDTIFNGYPAVKYNFASSRSEYFVPYGNQLFLVTTDRPNEGIVQSVLMTFRFMTPPQPVTYDVTLADNGRTFYMNIGDKLRINLDYSYIWSMFSFSNPAVLSGAGDGYFAFTSGTTTMTTYGNPECLNSTPPCLAPSIAFTLTVIVR